MSKVAEQKRLAAIHADLQARKDAEDKQKAARAKKEKDRQEQQMKGELRQQAKRERDKRVMQRTELKTLFSQFEDEVRSERKSALEKSQWDHYVECSKLPHPSSLPAINEYISDCKEEMESSRDEKLAFTFAVVGLQLLNKLNDLLLDARADHYGRKQFSLVEEGYANVSSFFNSQMELSTFYALMHCSSKIGKDNNFSECNASSYLETYIWANLARNKKIIQHEFGQLTASIPIQFRNKPVGIRVLLLRVDWLTPTSKNKDIHIDFICQSEPQAVFTMTGVDTDVTETETEVSDLSDVENKPETTAAPPITSAVIEMATKVSKKTKTSKLPKKGCEPKKKEKPPPPPPKLCAPNTTVRTLLAVKKFAKHRDKRKRKLLKQAGTLAELIASQVTENPGEESHEPIVEIAVNSIIRTDTADSTSSKKTDKSDKSRKDSRMGKLTDSLVNPIDYVLLNGIYELKIYNLPPQPISSGQWVLTQDITPVLSESQFPPSNDDASDSYSIIEIALKLPKDRAIITDEPTIAFWSSQESQWVKGLYTTHAAYEKENGVMRFHLHRMGCFALFQAKHRDFPYHSWDILPLGKSHIKFSLRTQSVKLFFEIKGERIHLMVPPKYEWPQLRFIEEEGFVTINRMYQMLQSAGLSLFPTEEMTEVSHDCVKAGRVEISAYRNMAYCCQYLAYSHSRFNSTISKDIVLFRGCLVKDLEQVSEENWQVFMVTPHTFRKLQISDKAAKFIDIRATNTQDHCTMPHLLCSLLEHEVNLEQIINHSSLTFVSTVYKWLLMTRILSYSN